MRLLHYSSVTLKSVHSIQQSRFGLCGNYKPGGLWVSVEGDDDWKSRTSENGFPRGLKVYEIVLAPTANLLHLATAKELDEFSAEYGFDAFDSTISLGHVHGIRWQQVAEKYQGILIAPYCWSRRLTTHTFWYYGWDCASGCIWDAAAVAEVRPL